MLSEINQIPLNSACFLFYEESIRRKERWQQGRRQTTRNKNVDQAGKDREEGANRDEKNQRMLHVYTHMPNWNPLFYITDMH